MTVCSFFAGHPSSMNKLAAQLSAPADPGAPRPLTDEQRNLIQAVKAVNASGMLGQDNELTFVLDRPLRARNRADRQQTDWRGGGTNSS